MKDLDTTFSHIVSRKIAQIREQNWMPVSELAERVWQKQPTISSILNRQRKWNEDLFTKMGIALGLPDKKIQELLHTSLFEAIEEEYWVWISFALKSQFGLSESAIRDVMKFIRDIQKKEQENS